MKSIANLNAAIAEFNGVNEVYTNFDRAARAIQAVLATAKGLAQDYSKRYSAIRVLGSDSSGITDETPASNESYANAAAANAKQSIDDQMRLIDEALSHIPSESTVLTSTIGTVRSNEEAFPHSISVSSSQDTPEMLVPINKGRYYFELFIPVDRSAAVLTNIKGRLLDSNYSFVRDFRIPCCILKRAAGASTMMFIGGAAFTVFPGCTVNLLFLPEHAGDDNDCMVINCSVNAFGNAAQDFRDFTCYEPSRGVSSRYITRVSSTKTAYRLATMSSSASTPQLTLQFMWESSTVNEQVRRGHLTLPKYWLQTGSLKDPTEITVRPMTGSSTTFPNYFLAQSATTEWSITDISEDASVQKEFAPAVALPISGSLLPDVQPVANAVTDFYNAS